MSSRPLVWGDFERLPGEIRKMIYSVYPAHMHNAPSHIQIPLVQSFSTTSTMALFCPSISILRPHHQSFKLWVRTTKPRGKHRNVVSATSAHPDRELVDLMPVDQFGKIRILINPPDLNNPVK